MLLRGQALSSVWPLAFRPLETLGLIVDDEDYSRATCDQCGIGVRAKFVIALPSGGVVCYCGSHTKTHWTALNELGALVVELSAA